MNYERLQPARLKENTLIPISRVPSRRRCYADRLAAGNLELLACYFETKDLLLPFKRGVPLASRIAR